MSTIDEFRSRTRETWAAGDWDGFAKYVAPVGAVALERGLIGPGMRLLDVGAGSGGNVAIPAALAGARVVGADLTPEMFPHARRRATRRRAWRSSGSRPTRRRCRLPTRASTTA